MNKRSKTYWQKRMELVQLTALKGASEASKDLEKQYAESIAQVEKEIAHWYQRFMDNENISMADAKKKLTRKELQEFKWTVEDYVAYARENELNSRWIKQLENASAKYHIDRLEMIKLQMQNEVEKLYVDRVPLTEEAMRSAYKESFYHTSYEISRGVGVGVSLNAIDESKVSSLIGQPWTADGKTFSKRIWTHQEKLKRALSDELTSAINKGYKLDDAVKGIQKRMESSKKDAKRLVFTESAYFSSQGQEESFNELGVEKYRYYATLDTKTSKTCQDLDGKVFLMSRREIGLNAPPMHAWCRSTTAPEFDDLKGIGTRAARDPKTGKTIQVPRDMSYKEWYDKYIQTNPQALIKEKAYKNRHTDQKQYETYKRVLGSKNVPRSFESFLEMKYNNTKEWGLLKDYKRSRSSNMISSWTSFNQYKVYVGRIDTELLGFTCGDGLKISSQSKHFIERIFGTSEDPKTKKPRSGVELETIKEVLTNQNSKIKRRVDSQGRVSFKYVGDSCEVSVNGEGMLIQVNPRSVNKND